MDNPTFVGEDDMPMVHQDDDYDDYNTPNTSRVDETSFTVPDITETTSTLLLRQKVKRDKINALYRHVNVTGDIDLIDLDWFRLITGSEKGLQFLSFTMVIGGSFNKTNRRVFCTKNFKG